TETASASGYSSSTTTAIVVTDGGTTTKNFALTAASQNTCLVDTTQADFQAGIPTNTDLATTAGSVILSSSTAVNLQTTNYTTSGVGFSNTSIAGQTFTPSVSGTLQKLDIQIFCSSCSGTNPNITVEVRTTSGGNIVMTAGGLLATTTFTGTSSG